MACGIIPMKASIYAFTVTVPAIYAALMKKPEEIILLDPLPVIDWPYQTLDAGESFCHEL